MAIGETVTKFATQANPVINMVSGIGTILGQLFGDDDSEAAQAKREEITAQINMNRQNILQRMRELRSQEREQGAQRETGAVFGGFADAGSKGLDFQNKQYATDLRKALGAFRRGA